MPGVEITVSTRQIQRMSERLASFQSKLRNPKGVASGVAALLESQTKRRIQDEKRSPEGEPWAKWSTDYAKSRKGNHSLLMFEGRLRDSIAGRALNGSTVVVGSSMVYARVHQEGWDERNIPARPYIGISDDNADEIVDMILDWAGEAVSA